MTMQEIKSYFGASALNFKRALTEEGQETEWYNAWIENVRVRLSIHEDIMAKIAANREFDKLSLKDDGVKLSQSGQEYRKYYIVIYPEIDYSF